MPSRFRSQFLWLSGGIALGWMIAQFWPHEPVKAAEASNEKFSMTSVTTTIGNSEGIFVLDHVTGQLVGAIMNNRTGKFGAFYTRNVAADFNIMAAGGDGGRYNLISIFANLPSQGRVTFARGVVCVGEMTTGMVKTYAIPQKQLPGPDPMPLVPVDQFLFRQP